MEKQNVIVIRGRGIEPAVNKLARSLARNGYQVDLLVWDRQGNAPEGGKDGFSVHRCRIRAPYDSPLAMLFLPFWWLYELAYLLKHDCSVIHACDIDTILPAVIAKVIRKVPLVYTIYDFYADCLPPATPSLLRRAIAAFDKGMIRFADTLILVDETRYAQVDGAEIRAIGYISNTPPETAPAATAGTARPWPGFTLFYAGAFLRDRGLDSLIAAIQDIPDVHLVIAGLGPELEMVRTAAEREPDRIHYLGFLSYDEVIARTREADMLFAFYDPAFPNNRYASPNKLFEAMMCRIPILTNDGTSMAGIVRRENCGLTVPYGDTGAIRSAILRLMRDPALCRDLGENGRRAYDQRYAWTIMETRLLALYEALGGRGS